jgi:predicted acyl esterase
VIWGPWTHSLGKEAERKHPEYYSTSNIKEQREREREREGNR